MCLGVLYHPPSSSTALFDTLLDIIYEVNCFTFSQIVLIGDFNTNVLVHSSHRDYVLSLCNDFNLLQMVRDSTYVCSDGYSSLLDLVLVSDPICVLHCCTIPSLGNSNHHGIFLCLAYPLLTKEARPRRVVWRYTHVCLHEFGKSLCYTVC